MIKVKDERERRERFVLAMLHAGIAPSYALSLADETIAALDGTAPEIERLRSELADAKRYDKTGDYEHAHEDVIPEPASPAQTRKRLEQLVAIVGASAYGIDSTHFASTLASVRDELLPKLAAVGAAPATLLVPGGGIAMATRTIQLSDGSNLTVDIAHADEIAAKLAAASKEERLKGERRQRILNTVSDLGAALLYYDRKEDDGLPVFAIEDAIIAGEAHVEEIVKSLVEQLHSSVATRRANPDGGREP